MNCMVAMKKVKMESLPNYVHIQKKPETVSLENIYQPASQYGKQEDQKTDHVSLDPSYIPSDHPPRLSTRLPQNPSENSPPSTTRPIHTQPAQQNSSDDPYYQTTQNPSVYQSTQTLNPQSSL